MEENLNTLTAEEPTGLERLDAYIGTVVDKSGRIWYIVGYEILSKP